MDKRNRIAFIRPKAWPLANRNVEEVLRTQFPDHALDVFDVTQMVRKHPLIITYNIVATLLLYGVDIVKRRKKFRIAFWRTPYIFKQVKSLIVKAIRQGPYLFSFQMQSLFDCSTPGLPHFIYTDHTHLENLSYTNNGRTNLFSPSWIELERSIYQNATLNFVRSSNVRRSMIDDYHCPPDKVVLIYAGSNASVNSIKTENMEYEDPHILFVGFDWKRKGGPDLIEAFKLVREKCPQAKLTILGAKPELHAPNIEIIGRVSPEELDRYYQRSSVFCLPTHLEPFGIVFIEAMTAHLPIVATRVGAIPDFVEDGRNGWLVEPGDIVGLANALIKLLNDPTTARQFGNRSSQIIQERYSWETVGKRFKEQIQNVLDRQ
jgi:glycosyltransferase involved in cell wall biosynthesis